MKRYCQTLELVGDSQMIESYIEAHRHVWPEIQEGIRSVGILDIVGTLSMSCVHILTHDQRKPLKASPLIAAVRPGATMRRRSRLY